jgi:hypothetical protein
MRAVWKDAESQSTARWSVSRSKISHRESDAWCSFPGSARFNTTKNSPLRDL